MLRRRITLSSLHHSKLLIRKNTCAHQAVGCSLHLHNPIRFATSFSSNKTNITFAGLCKTQLTKTHQQPTTTNNEDKKNEKKNNSSPPPPQKHANKVFRFVPSVDRKNTKVKVFPWSSSLSPSPQTPTVLLEIEPKLLDPSLPQDEDALFDIAGQFVHNMKDNDDLMVVLVVDYNNSSSDFGSAKSDQAHNQAENFSKILSQVGCHTFVVPSHQRVTTDATADAIFESIVPTDEIVLLDACISRISSPSSENSGGSADDIAGGDSSAGGGGETSITLSFAACHLASDDKHSRKFVEFHGSAAEATQKFISHLFSIPALRQPNQRILFITTPKSNSRLLNSLIKTIDRRRKTCSKSSSSRFLPSSALPSDIHMKIKNRFAVNSQYTSKDRIRAFEEVLSISSIGEFRSTTLCGRLLLSSSNNINSADNSALGDTVDVISRTDLILSPDQTVKNIIDRHDSNNNNNGSTSPVNEPHQHARDQSDPGTSQEHDHHRIHDSETITVSNQSSTAETSVRLSPTVKRRIQEKVKVVTDIVYKNKDRLSLNRKKADEYLKRFVVMTYRTNSPLMKMYKREGNPNSQENRIEEMSFLDYKGNYYLYCSNNNNDNNDADANTTTINQFPPLANEFDTLVVHGSKEALLYFNGNDKKWQNDENLMHFLRKGGRIWCTAVAEYALSGFIQPDTRYPENLTLDHIALRHSLLPLFSSNTTNNYETAHNDNKSSSSSSLMKECELVTNIFKSQVRQAVDQVQVMSLLYRMDATLFHTEVEQNGIFVCPPHFSGFPKLLSSDKSSSSSSQQQQHQTGTSSPSASSISTDIVVNLNFLARKIDKSALTLLSQKTELCEILQHTTDLKNRKTKSIEKDPVAFVNQLAKKCDYRVFYLDMSLHENDRITDISCFDSYSTETLKSKVDPLRRVHVDENSTHQTRVPEGKSTTKKGENQKQQQVNSSKKNNISKNKKDSEEDSSSSLPTFKVLSPTLLKFLRLGSSYSDRVVLVFQNSLQAEVFCHHFLEFVGHNSLPFSRLLLFDGSFLLQDDQNKQKKNTKKVTKNLDNGQHQTLEQQFETVYVQHTGIRRYNGLTDESRRRTFASIFLERICQSNPSSSSILLSFDEDRNKIHSVPIPLKAVADSSSKSKSVIDEGNNKNKNKSKNPPLTEKEQKVLSRWISFGNNNNYPDSFMNTAFVNPFDHCIHQEVRLCSSSTGRTSSRSPNCQTIPRLEKPLSAPVNIVRKSIVSRFGPEEGYILEFDFKQLEIAVQCLLAQDKQMLEDMRNGVDFHLKRCVGVLAPPDVTYEELRELYKKGDPRTKDMRTKAKQISFQRMYGAGIFALSQSTGLTADVIQRLIDAESLLYPEVAILPYVSREVCLRKDNPSPDVDKFRLLELPTGGRVALGRNAVERMSPIIKNYPVQGYAAELMSIVLGNLYREMLLLTGDEQEQHQQQRCFVINFVHDSVWLDCHASVVQDVYKKVTTNLSKIRELLERDFPGAPSNVEFGVSATIGRSLAEMRDYHGEEIRDK